MVEIRVLGPVEAWVGERAVPGGRPQQATVLAALAIDVGRPVAVETLVERVWGTGAPDGARRAVHTHVARIRRALGGGVAGGPVVRRSGGYQLDVAPERVDLHRFRRAVDHAGQTGRSAAERVAVLREAVGLWRGEPLAGLPGGWADRMRQGLRRQRVEAVVAWTAAEVSVGNPAAVLAPLSELVGDHPLVEPLTVALMRALAAAGRTAEALECYAATRRRLVEELGADPGPELREAHRWLLRGGAHRPAPAPSAERGGVPAQLPPERGAVPAQLPLEGRGFAGRREELARLDEVLAEATGPTGAGPGEAPGAAVVCLTGMGGVGKTALAVRWAHRVAGRFPDGQLYVNLRGFDPGGGALSPAEVVRQFLEAFGVAADRLPAGLDAQVGLYRSLLHGRRVLVVLDNARDADQVRPLLPGAAGCLTLVTSRDRLTGLVVAAGARSLPLRPLPAEAARELLARRLGERRTRGAPGAVDEIVRRCAGLPLALAVAAARAAARPDFPLQVTADELSAARGGLGAFAGQDPATDARAVFSWSYRQLGADAAGLFRALGLHPGPDLSAPAAASLAGLPLPRARQLLAELTGAHLLIEHAPGRYAPHDLLHAYAAELAGTLDGAAARRAARHRLLDHYLHTACAAGRRLKPNRRPVSLEPPAPGVRPERLPSQHAALAWLTVEHPVLLVVVRWAAGAGFDGHAWQLAQALVDVHLRQGHWQDQLAVQEVALSAARRLGDPTRQAASHRHLARTHTRLGRADAADREFRTALELSRAAGDRLGEADIHRGLAGLLGPRGDHATALRHARRALVLYRLAGDRPGQAEALNSIAWCHAHGGDQRRALERAERALALFQALGDRYDQAETWDTLGLAHHRLHHHDEAAGCYRQAIALFRTAGDRFQVADTLHRLGDTHHAAGDLPAARRAWRRALTTLTDLHHPSTTHLRTKLGGA